MTAGTTSDIDTVLCRVREAVERAAGFRSVCILRYEGHQSRPALLVMAWSGAALGDAEIVGVIGLAVRLFL